MEANSSSSQPIIPPPPAGFDFDAPPPQRAASAQSASAIPPPPTGFDFEAPPKPIIPAFPPDAVTGPIGAQPVPRAIEPAIPPDAHSGPIVNGQYSLPIPDMGGTSQQIASNPPGVPKSPIPFELQTPTQQAATSLAGGSTFQNPRTGRISPRLLPGNEPGPLSFLDTAPQHVVHGVEALASPAQEIGEQMARGAGPTQINLTPEAAKSGARGLGELGTAALEAGTVLLPEQLVTNPIGVIKTLAAAIAAGKATTAGLQHLGVAPEYANLAGDIAGLVAGYGVHWAGARPEVKAIVEAAQNPGPDGDPIDADLISRLMAMAGQHEQSPFEARIARSMLREKYGIHIPEPPVAAEPAQPPPPEPPPVDWSDPSGIQTEQGPLGPDEESATGATPPKPTPTVNGPQGRPEPAPTVNAADFQKAHATWEKARTGAAMKFMETHPGASYGDALARTRGTYGVEPHPRDFRPIPEPPPPPPEPEPVEPPKPTQVERVSPSTPNPPTAYAATEPESPETIALQMEQLGIGTRRVVMFPKGQGQPSTYPPGVALTHDKLGNTYAYRPDLIKKSEIHSAAMNNTLPAVLGGPMGMGAPDKSALQGQPIAVVARGPDGTEAQTTVTDEPSLPVTHAATQLVTPPGGTVSIETPEGALAGRTREVAPEEIPQIPQSGNTANTAIPPPPPGFDFEGPPQQAASAETVPVPTETTAPITETSASPTETKPATTETPAAPKPGDIGSPEKPYYTREGMPVYYSGGKWYGHDHGWFPLEQAARNEVANQFRRGDLTQAGPAGATPPATPVEKPATQVTAKPEPAKPTAQPSTEKSTDKSVQDFTTTAWHAGEGNVEAVVRNGRAIIARLKFPVKDWPKGEFGRNQALSNPMMPQRQFVQGLLGKTDIQSALDKIGEGNERINDNTLSRIADSVHSAVRKALGEKEVPVRTPTVSTPILPPALVTENIPPHQPIQVVESEAFPPTIAESPSDESPQIKLANAALRILQNGERFGNNVEFQKLADQAFGGSRASGKYDMKQAYDALEAAVNRYIADSIGPDLLTGDPVYAVQQLRELMSHLPTQNVRTENQELLQQFSTPPTLSFLAAKLAGLRTSDIVGEPSAGTGSLAAFAKASGAIVRANEIDPRRAELLGYAVRGSSPTQVDAEFLNSTWPADIKPTVILMNPPFSATGGRLSANKNTFGYRHVIEALKRLTPGGRLVAILGEGAMPNAPNAKAFWLDIAKQKATLRANVGISGKEYAKYGTTFGNRMIVVDKATPLQMVEQLGHDVQPIYGEYNTIEDAFNAVQRIIGERSEPVSEAVVRTGGSVRGPAGEKPAVPGERGVGVKSPVTRTPDINVPASQPGDIAGSVRGQEPGIGPEVIPTTETRTGTTGDSGESAVEPLRPDDRVALEARKKEDLLDRTEDDGSFVEYVPSIEGLAHPGRLVETKVMASVNPPPVTYKPNLPANAKAPKPLSAAQMESVARAGMMHQTFDEAGNRQGYLMGDGTGVGKGQQIAAIIWDRNRNGQKRAIWISASKGLQKAAKGDFIGIGAKDLSEQLHSLNDWNAADEINLKEGIVFSTYQSLVAKAKGEKGQTRLDQIKNWLGPEGVIIFDESQKGKNAVAGTGRAVSSKTGENVVKLQDDLPRSYVVYASATAATDVNNLGYMVRMGLWGKGTPFHQGFGHFMTEVGRGGIAAMELIAREMKATGKYLSRSISFKGVTFDEKIHELTPEQRKTYDTAVKGWQQVLTAGLDQLKDNNADGSRALGEFTQNYWGTHQRFFRKLLTAMKVPSVLELVDKALADNKSIVISLIGTGQAQADQAMASGAAEDEDDLDFSPKDSLLQMVRQSFPTTLYEEYEDEQGNVKKRPVIRDGKIVENPEAIARRDALVDELNRELALPDNPLDFIIRNYGRENVSELTGRKKSVERNKATGKWENVSRAPEGVPMDKINEYEMEQFQSGKKRIAIISKASGAGFSLHADLAAKNQQPRFHVVMELSWSADDQMQSFGRTHRSNQKQPPEYVILSTDAGGEKRFSSTIARRLESLGALTKGQRDASGGNSVLAKYNFETTQGEQAAQAFYQYLLEQNPTIEGTTYTGHDLLKQMGILKQRTNDAGEPIGPPTIERENLTNVTRLMNRVMNVELGAKPANHQNATFELFTSLFDQAVQRAIENGTLDTGVNLVRGDHIRLIQAKPIAKDEASGAETYRYTVEAERQNKPVSVNVVRDLYSKGRGQMMKRREFKGVTEPDQLVWAEKSRTPITNRNGNIERAYNTFGPAHREAETAHDRISESDLNLNWEPIEGSDAVPEIKRLDKSIPETETLVKTHQQRLDAGQYNSLDYYKRDLEADKTRRKELIDQVRRAKSEQFDLWKQAYEAAPKNRIERIDMIGGSVMRVWPLLKVGNGRMDIRIAYPDSGGSITGVAMTEGDANAVEQALTGQTVVRGPGSVFDAAIQGKESFQLTGGVRLSQGRINREPVIEVVTNDSNNQRFLDQIGVKKEKIGWQYRYYIPNDAAVGVPIVEKLLKQYPVIDQGKPAGRFGSERGSLSLGPLNTAVDAGAQFFREEVIPKAAAIFNGSRDIAASVANFLDPRRNVPTKTLDTIYRMKGGREAAEFLVASRLDKWSSRVNKMTQDQQVEFVDRIKTGKPQEDVHGNPDKELQELADFIRRVDDALYQEIAKYKPSLDYLENHFRVLWKVIPGSPQAKANLAGKGVGTAVRMGFRRPLQGSKGFLKQSKLADMSEGLALGGAPRSYNPIKNFLAHYSDAEKFITAQRLWAQFKKDGIRKFVPFGKPAPEGYQKLDDAIARVYFPVKEGMVTAGDWYVEKGAANLLNTMLGRDYLREVYADTPISQATGNLGRALLAIKNNSTAIELALSPFHAVFEGIEAVGSEMGIGMREMWNLGVRGGKPAEIAKGFGRIITAPKVPVTAAKFGASAKKAFGDIAEMQKTVAGRKWLADNPAALDDVKYFFLGGGKMGMPPEFRTDAMNGLRDYLKSARSGNNPGHYISALLRSIPALNQAIMSPLFEHYIPNLKLGFFLKEFALGKQEYADRLLSGEMSLEQLARKTLDSVENRFGEMNFENLFWDRTFKSAMQLAFRSVTWKLGNIRAEAGAITGQGKEFKHAFQNKEIPLLHSNMAWFLGMTLATAVLGTVIHTLGTKKPPQQLKDVIYPMIDDKAGIRVSMPTYWRDMMHAAHSPGGYVKSSLSGDIGKLADVWENKDFPGNEVYNPDDPKMRQLMDAALHFVPLPFSISSATQAKQQGGSPITRAAGYLGFTKAPKYIEQSKAENLASEYMAGHREVGSRTAFEGQRSQAQTGIRNIYKRGGNPAKEIKDAEDKGLITPRDVNSLRKQVGNSYLTGVLAGSKLTMPESLRIYDAATSEEKRQIEREVRKKVRTAKPGEWGKPGSQERALAQKYFNYRPYVPVGSPAH